MFIEYQDAIELYKDNIPASSVGIKVYKTNILSAPKKRLEFIEVEGKNGALTIDHESYEDFTLTLECAIVNQNENRETMQNLCRRAKQYLLTGTNCKLQTSEDRDFYLEGTYASNVDIDEAMENFGLFQAQFRCKPFRYANNLTSRVISAQNTIIKNQGQKIYPIISIIGTGDITININSQQLILKALDGQITVDCEKMNCYKKNNLGTMINLNQKMYSDFPFIGIGENRISWQGASTISKIEFTYRLAVI